MSISPISAVSPRSAMEIQRAPDRNINTEKNSKSERSSFNEILKESITNLDHNITTTQQSLENIISGKSDDIHKFIVESEKTAINLQMTLQVRNKIVDAYNEIMRMQV